MKKFSGTNGSGGKKLKGYLKSLLILSSCLFNQAHAASAPSVVPSGFFQVEGDDSGVYRSDGSGQYCGYVDLGFAGLASFDGFVIYPSFPSAQSYTGLCTTPPKSTQAGMFRVAGDFSGAYYSDGVSKFCGYTLPAAAGLSTFSDLPVYAAYPIGQSFSGLCSTTPANMTNNAEAGLFVVAGDGSGAYRSSGSSFCGYTSPFAAGVSSFSGLPSMASYPPGQTYSGLCPSASAPASPVVTTATPIPISGSYNFSLIGTNLSGGEFGPVGGAFNSAYTYPSHQEIDYFAAKGFKIIRLPFLIERVQPAMNAALSTTELGLLDDLVNYANSKGVIVLLDAHNFGYMFNQLIASETTYAALANFWGQMAAHYGNANVFFGLMNEPHDQTPEQWLPAVNQSIAAIRASGAKQKITVPGVAWTGAWTWISSGNAAVVGAGVVDSGHNYLFEVHQYLDSDSSGTHNAVVSATIGAERLAAVTQWAEQNGQQLLLGELGVGTDALSLQALSNTLQYMKQHAGVWAGLTYWSAGPWWGNYMYTLEPTNNLTTDQPQLMYLQQYIP